jgi:hypothetical protein
MRSLRSSAVAGPLGSVASARFVIGSHSNASLFDTRRP